METGISSGIQDGQAREHQRLPGFLMDDLKLYSSTERQHGVKLAMTHQMMSDTGLTMAAAKKTKNISIAKEKRKEQNQGLKLAEDLVIDDLGGSLYKFLGVEEAEQHENKMILKKAEKEVIRRVSVILDTPMSDKNKIDAIDTFALPVITFFMPVIYFSQEDLNEVDLKIKRLLTERGARHPQHLNSLLSIVCSKIYRRARPQANRLGLQRD